MYVACDSDEPQTEKSDTTIFWKGTVTSRLFKTETISEAKMSSSGDFGNPLRKFKLVFLGEQSGKNFAGSTHVA